MIPPRQCFDWEQITSKRSLHRDISISDPSRKSFVFFFCLFNFGMIHHSPTNHSFSIYFIHMLKQLIRSMHQTKNKSGASKKRWFFNRSFVDEWWWCLPIIEAVMGPPLPCVGFWQVYTLLTCHWFVLKWKHNFLEIRMTLLDECSGVRPTGVRRKHSILSQHNELWRKTWPWLTLCLAKT